MLTALFAGGITGALFGFVLQRGRFCMTSAFRDPYMARDWTLFKAYVLSLAIQATGIILLQGAGIIQAKPDSFQWLAAVTGGLIFGFSLIFAGGCASGTYYRIGEGMVGSIVTAVFYGLGAAASRNGALLSLTKKLQASTVTVNGATTLYGALGISPWVLVAGLWIVSILFLVRSHRQEQPSWAPPAAEGRSPLWQTVFGRSWAWPATGLAVGLVSVLAWLTSTATGQPKGLGITSATAGLVRFLVTGDLKLVDWNVFMILGIPLGSYLAARAAGEFRLRVPGPERLLQHMVGGLGMGIGATIARGCNVGNSLVSVSLFNLNGWVATVATILGIWAGAYLFLVLPARTRASAAVAGLPAQGD